MPPVRSVDVSCCKSGDVALSAALLETSSTETSSLTITSCATRGAADSMWSLSLQQAADILHGKLTPDPTPRLDQHISDSSDGETALSDFGLSARQLQETLHKHGCASGRGADIVHDRDLLGADRAERGVIVENPRDAEALDRTGSCSSCSYSSDSLSDSGCSDDERGSVSDTQRDSVMSRSSAKEAALRYKRYRDALKAPPELTPAHGSRDACLPKATSLINSKLKLAGTSCVEAIEDDGVAWLWIGPGDRRRREEVSECTWAGVFVEAELAGLTPSEKPAVPEEVLGPLWWTKPGEAWAALARIRERWTDSISCTFRERR